MPEDDRLCPCGHPYGEHYFQEECLAEGCNCKDNNANGIRYHVYFGKLVPNRWNEQGERVPMEDRPCQMAYCNSKKLTKKFLSVSGQNQSMCVFICDDCSQKLRG